MKKFLRWTRNFQGKNLQQNLPGSYIYRETLNLIYVRFISFLSPIYVQLSLMWYSSLLGLQYSTRNFKELLFCEMIPLLFAIFDWAKTEVPSIILIVIGRLHLHNIKKFSTDMPCNVTPTYGAKQYSRASITRKCDACAWSILWNGVANRNSYLKKYDLVLVF